MPINAALLGSGLFATNAYLPAILPSAKDITLHSIWSRSEKSVTTLLDKTKELGFPSTPQVLHGDDGLENVLNNKEIDAVMLVLPIGIQPTLVRKALKAGKHVLCEKPIAKDVKSARELIEEYEKEYKPKGLIFRIAENWAHEPIIRYAREVLQDKAIGPVLYYQLKQDSVVVDGSAYQATQWRTIPDYQGGFILDGGVHSTAILRTVLPNPPASIISTSSLHRTHLLPHDTVIGLALPPPSSATTAHGPPTKLKTPQGTEVVPTAIGQSSANGTILLTWAFPDVPQEAKTPNGCYITCLNGTVNITSAGGKFKIKVTGAKDSGVKDEEKEEKASGVQVEVAMYARAVAEKKAGKEAAEENWGDVRGAMWDLAVIEAMLKSEGKEINLEKLLTGN